MQKARRHPLNGLRPLVSTRFQGLFHSLVQGSFHLSFTVLVRYRSLRSIQPYQMVLANSDRITHVPSYSGYYQVYKAFRVRDYHPLWYIFPNISTILYNSMLQSYNPDSAETKPVWAISSSLATTTEITIVFSSCAYLDVSVQRVCFHLRGCLPYDRRVSPFGYVRIKRYLLLPVPFRSLSRPSSPLRAQAFPVCPQ